MATYVADPPKDDSPCGINEAQKTADDQLNWLLLQYFNIYRTGLATLATFGSLVIHLIAPFGKTDPELFQATAITYFIVSLFGLRITYMRQPDFYTQAGVFAFADVTFITLLTHASGGLASSLGLFLVVAVAGTSLLLNKRMTIFVAALASIAALLQHSWGLLTGTESYASTVLQGFPQVGALGIGLFTAAALGYTLAQRLRVSEDIARRRGADLSNLAKVNSMIIERMESAVLVCDDHCRITQYNTQAQRFFELPAPEKNKPKPTLTSTSRSLQNALEEWLTFPSRQQHSPIQTKSGITVVPRFSPVSENRGDGVLIFLSDANALKQQAQQLKMAALARLTASIAHEIRNPLGAISNASQLLTEAAADNAEDKRLAQIISDHCKRMNEIIENITQLARRDRLRQERQTLFEWLQYFKHQFIEETGLSADVISITGSETLEVCMDTNQMAQVLTNLVQNGLRHSPEFTGKALIDLEIGTAGNDQPFLNVSDHGGGIAPEIAENIFDPFFTTASSGTGLGLYISRELCDSNGGGLQHISDYTEGARFRINFPPARECS